MPETRIDPREFFGIGANAPAPLALEVPDKLDPREFLGIGPGVSLVPTQSARSANPPSWGAINQIGSGFALGFGPELEGAENYLLSGRDSKATLDQQIYNRRQAKSLYEKANPVLATGLELAGSAPTTVGVNAMIPGLSLLTRNARLPLRMLGGVIEGAETSALQSKLTGGDPRENALGGAFIGGTFPGATAVAGRLLKPAVESGVVDTVRAMERLGVRLRPSQVAMSQALRQADEFFASGGNEAQLKDFTRAVSRSFGEDTAELTPRVAGQAWDRITSEMDGIANLTQVVMTKGDPLDAGIAQIASKLSGLQKAEQDQVRSVIRELRNRLKSGSFGGKDYQDLTSIGGSLMNLSKAGHPAVRKAGGELRELLDDAVERHSAPGVREQWSEARAQLKNLLAVQPLIEGNPSGIINPQALHGRVKSFFDEYGWGSALPGGMDVLAEGGRFLPKSKLTGDAAVGERLPILWRYGPGAAIGAGGAYVLGGDLKTIGLMGAGLASADVLKHIVGGALKSSAYRNALTGGVSEPGIAGRSLKAFGIGAANASGATKNALGAAAAALDAQFSESKAERSSPK